MQQVAAAHKIPTRIQEVAKAQRLGMLHRVYSTKKEPLLFRILGPVALLIGILIVVSFFLSDTTIASWLPPWQTILIPIIGVGWIIVGTWITLTALVSRRICVFVYDHGLIYQQPRLTVMRREQIETLWKDVRTSGKADKTRTTRMYTMHLSNGKRYIFHNNLNHIQELGNLFEQELSRRHLPKAIATYKADSPVSFNMITISQQGMEIHLKRGKQHLLWSDIEHIALKETAMSIYKRGESEPWCVIPGGWIPNLAVLKGLLYDIRRPRPRYALDPLSQLIATYKAGLPITLGNLTISTQGITIDDGKKLFPWSELASIGVGEEEVIIRTKGQSMDWYVLPAWMISDITLLKGLIDAIMR